MTEMVCNVATIWCWLALALTTTSAMADVPSDKIWGGVGGFGMPNYFSGTNARVFVSVESRPPTSIG